MLFIILVIVFPLALLHYFYLNIWFVGTAGEATHDIYQAKLTGPLAIVMGAEGDGGKGFVPLGVGSVGL